MLIPLAPRLLLLVLVSPQTHSTLFLMPALELVNAVTPYKHLGKISDILHLNNKNN